MEKLLDTQALDFAEMCARECELIDEHEDKELMDFIEAEWGELEPY